MQLSSLHTRAALPQDAPALANLVNSVYRGDSSRRGWTTEAELLDGQRTDAVALQEFLSRPDDEAVMLVGEIESEIMACLQLERHGSEAHLGMLSVTATRQDHGLGRGMLAAAERHARDVWRADTLALSVIHLRHELIAWYERRGFIQTGERSAFPYGDARFGLPKRADLWFLTLRKTLHAA